jgi:hypothetical protein
VILLEAMMKYLPILALLCCTAGCGLFGSSDSEPRAADPAEAERAETRSKIAARQQDLNQANADLAKIASERQELSKAEASETKNNRLVELARLESDTKQKQASLTDEIAQLQLRMGGPAPAPAPAAKPKSANDSLDDLLTANDAKDKEDADRRKKKAEDEAAADKNRIAQAESARKAEMDERAKQKIEGGRAPAAGADGPGYEERWADVITKIRAELQRYKRW